MGVYSLTVTPQAQGLISKSRHKDRISLISSPMDAMLNFSPSSSHRIQTRDLDDVNITFPDVRACNGVFVQAGECEHGSTISDAGSLPAGDIRSSGVLKANKRLDAGKMG